MLIIDSGSTKAEWYYAHGGETKTFTTEGLNPLFHTSEQIISLIYATPETEALRGKVRKIYFYGASCTTDERIERVRAAFSGVFEQAQTEVNHDLMGAARATCGHEPGMVCILGTGSSAGYFDGKELHRKTRSLGYILGDEGSGAGFGKKLLPAYLYGQLENTLHKAFRDRYPDLHVDSVIEAIYRQPNPNRYLASFMHFAASHRNHPTIRQMLMDGFEQFLKIHVVSNEPGPNHKVHFIGSVAFHFRDELQEVLSLLKLTPGKIEQSPMEGLVAYHTMMR